MKYRRRQYIVDSGFQGRFVLGFVLATLAGSIAATAFFYFLAINRLEKLQWSVFVNARSAAEVIQPLFIHVNLIAIAGVSLLLFATWAWLIKRMNGPLNGMIQNLKRVNEGDFSVAVTLRRNDEFRDVAAALNEMLNKMRDRFRGFEDGCEEVSKALADLEVAVAKGVPSRGKEERILMMIGKLQDKIAAGEEVSSEPL